MKVAQGAQGASRSDRASGKDAVKLIRGTKGTEVRLTLNKDGWFYEDRFPYPDEIVQDDTDICQKCYRHSDKGKVGYIYLPEFYADLITPRQSLLPLT